MENKIFNWRGYEWLTQERWGDVHKDKPWAKYDKSCVNILPSGELELTIGKNNNGVFDMGLVSSTRNNPRFKYGIYTWTAKLPKGKSLWPALWMWSFDSWPPEIDIVEAWTNGCGGYYKFPFKWNVTTNLHDPNAKYNMVDRVGICKMPDPTEKFIEYELVWMPDFLDFYYNGKRIRTIDDPKLMKYLNENTKKGMNIIMNLYPTEDYKEGNMKSSIIIKDFRYVRY